VDRPSGVGLLTHYMPAHYAGGWWMDSSTTLAEAEDATYELFRELKSVALTRNVLLPVGTDYTPPNAWVTDIHHDWNSRYTWPSVRSPRSSSPPCAPNSPNAGSPPRRRPAT
jgi:alpha-mannosidase